MLLTVAPWFAASVLFAAGKRALARVAASFELAGVLRAPRPPSGFLVALACRACNTGWCHWYILNLRKCRSRKCVLPALAAVGLLRIVARWFAANVHSAERRRGWARIAAPFELAGVLPTPRSLPFALLVALGVSTGMDFAGCAAFRSGELFASAAGLAAPVVGAAPVTRTPADFLGT